MAYKKPTVAGRKLATRKRNTATMNARRAAATKKAASTTGNKGGATRGTARAAQVQARRGTKDPNGSAPRTQIKNAVSITRRKQPVGKRPSR